MTGVLRKIFFALSVCAILCFWQTPVEAARQFTVTQVTTPTEFPMGAGQPVTFTAANTSNGTNAGETITTIQFNVSGTYSYFPPQTITPPTGWTCSLSRSSGSNYRRITCSANSTAYRIPSPSSQNFTFSIINNTTLTTDRNDALSSVVASFWSGSRTRNITLSNRGAWTWKSLLMTLVPSAATVGNNCKFTLTMTVTNKTSITLNPVVPVPSPRPTANTTSANVDNPAPVPASASLNLPAGAQGTIAWTYTLTDTGGAGGAVSFTACASTSNSCATNSGTSRTSASVTSVMVNLNTALVCGFTIASFTNNPDCLYSGDIATFVMVVSNNTAAAVNNVVPVPSVPVPVVTGSAAIGALNPAVQTPISIASNATGTFTWTAPVTGNPNDTYAVQGSASNGVLTTATVTSTVRDVDGYSVVAGTTNAGSADAEIVWNITNWACSDINQVSLAVPGGWTFDDDGYALVKNMAGIDDDSWTRPAGSTTFTAQTAGDRIPSGGSVGSYALLFSQTPNAAGIYNFNVTITDAAGVVRVVPSAVTVNLYNTGGLNATGTGIWHEDVQ